MTKIRDVEVLGLKLKQDNLLMSDRAGTHVFSLKRWGFYALLLIHFTPLVGNMLYIQYKHRAVYVADVTNLEPLQEVKFAASTLRQYEHSFYG